MIDRQSPFHQGIDGQGRIPYRGMTGLKMETWEGLTIITARGFALQSLDFTQRFLNQWMLDGITQCIQGKNGIGHGRINRSQATGPLHVLDHPFFRFTNGAFAQRQ